MVVCNQNSKIIFSPIGLFFNNHLYMLKNRLIGEKIFLESAFAVKAVQQQKKSKTTFNKIIKAVFTVNDNVFLFMFYKFSM